MSRLFKTGITAEGDIAVNNGNLTTTATTVREWSPAAAASPTTVYLGYHGANPSSSTNIYIGGLNSAVQQSAITLATYINSVYTNLSGSSVITSINNMYSNSGTNTVSLNTGFANTGTSNVNLNNYTNSTGTQNTTIGSSQGTNAVTIYGTTTSYGLALASTASTLSLNGSVGTSGQVLTSAGAGVTPTWSTVPTPDNDQMVLAQRIFG